MPHLKDENSALRFVAFLTNTNAGAWEVVGDFPEVPARGGEREIRLTEVDGIGVEREVVGDLVSQGNTEGQEWKLTTQADLDDEVTAEHIGNLVKNGFTSGYEPYWEISIDGRPKRTVVFVENEDGIDIKPSEDDEVLAQHFQTWEEMRDDPDTADLVVETAPAKSLER